MTGPMKLLAPQLAEAWTGQLLAARIPIYELWRWGVPFLEILLGRVLALGYIVRPAAILSIAIMIVAA